MNPLRRIGRAALIMVLLAAAGCFDGPFGQPDEPEVPAVNTTLRALCDLYAGRTFELTGDIAVAGVVTADDRGGNFYRALVIQDEGAGLEIRAAVDALHNDYPVGCRVVLRLQGLAIGSEYGILQAGMPPAAGSSYATDYIPSKAALDAVLLRDGAAVEPVAPELVTLPELTPSRCGTLVRIYRLHRDEPEADSQAAPATWSGYRRFADDAGHTIYTYVRSYADFADRPLPEGFCTLTGILQYDRAGDGRYILKLRDADDCIP